MTNTKFENRSDAQLQDLKTQLQASCEDCTNQAGKLWGQGFQDGADIFNKQAEEFDKLIQDVDKELKARAEDRLTPEQKKAQKAAEQEQEEQNISSYPPHIKPADQATPATQPYEPSTEAQQQQKNQTGGGSSGAAGKSDK